MVISVVSTEGPLDFARGRLRPERRDLLSTIGRLSPQRPLATLGMTVTAHSSAIALNLRAVFQLEHVQPGKAPMSPTCPRSTSGGLSHETQSDLGLCSMVVPVVVACETQRALVAEPPIEKEAAQLRERRTFYSGRTSTPSCLRISDCSLSLMVSPA